MKYPSHEYGLPLSVQGAFFGYRWLAWVAAGLLLTLPGGEAAASASHALLLLLLLAVNVTLTAIAERYVALVRRQPGMLAIDLLIGGMVVALSGGHMLPFFPYALAGLILPALLFGWRGALMAGLGFVIIDQAGLLLTASQLEAQLFPLFGRISVPLGFAAACVLLRRVISPEDMHTAGESGTLFVVDAGQTLQVRSDDNPPLRMRERAPERQTLLAPSTDAPAQRGPALAGLTPIAEVSPLRRALYECAPEPAAGLPTALERIKQWLEQEPGLQVRLNVIGAVQPLAAAHYQVLLRMAQEAALNIHQHAAARQVQVQLQYEPRAVSLSIRDDGVGLLDGTYERPGLHGLRMIRYRIAELDGQFAVFESESGGVAVRTTLPL